MVHFLKIFPDFFQPMVKGMKNFEVRKKDRNFKVGDYIAFNEFDPESGYTKRSYIARIFYILDDVRYCKEDYVILGFNPCYHDCFSCVLTKDNFYEFLRWVSVKL